ncbi:hypothetical protein [Rhodococcoides yunnanense]|uniref:Uncharacterized protein n=1 Tax=Rhodococcoides yunnanense TaxID=278209 RepID=A0ABU4B6I3_9NOCA|nr:hypothetical protein [Rhodococcus yunnanensis]MDV6259798.1 hypothetical protein [Rhodococcus yunnanensis]
MTGRQRPSGAVDAFLVYVSRISTSYRGVHHCADDDCALLQAV